MFDCHSEPVFQGAIRISLALFATAAFIGCAESDREPAREPEARTSPDSASSDLGRHWRIGFQVADLYVLEAPELGEVSEDLLRGLSEDAPPLDPEFGRLRIVPLDRVGEAADSLVNPEQWTVVALDGDEQLVGFPLLGYVEGAAFQETWHLVSEDGAARAPFVETDTWISDAALVIGIAQSVSGTVEVRRTLQETPLENDLPAQNPEHFPAGYEQATRVLDSEDSATGRLLSGTSIEAMVDGRLREVWLLDYGVPDLSVGSLPWGIFVSFETELEPIYLSPSEPWDGGRTYGSNYHAALVAALDLDRDGNDEFVIHAAYYEGEAFKIVAFRDGRYQEVLSSYYRGL